MGQPKPLRYAACAVIAARRPTIFARRSSRRPTAVAVAAIVAVGLSVTACDRTQPYAVIVNGNKVSQAHLFKELRALRDNTGFVTAYNQAAVQGGRQPIVSQSGTNAKPSFSQSFVAVVLGTDVQAAVVHAEVVKRRIEPNERAVQAADAAAGQQFGNGADNKPVYPNFNAWFRHLFDTRQAETDALRKALGTTSVDDGAIQKYYDDNPTLFISNQCVSHILVKSKEQAVALRSQIVGGADFATLAKANSTDPGSGAKGGELGCAKPGGFVKEFEAVADTIALNQLSDPVQTQFGFHLIKVTERTKLPLTDQLKTAIRQRLQQQSDNPLNNFFQESAKHLKVMVNPAYGSWDAQQLQVVPPKTPGANSGKPVPAPPVDGSAPGGAPGSPDPGAGQAPSGQAPSGQAPAGQAPAGQPPAGQAPAGQAPAGQATPPTSAP
ncbi:MAG: hypothetical protein NVS3B21_21430 [Acidimicrobiales bacterium]